MRLPLLTVLLVVAAPVVAQTFPAPGTGPYTWQRVGNKPLNSESFAFAPGGRVYAGSDSVYVLEPSPAGPPAGRWRGRRRPGGIEALLPLGVGVDGDTVLAGHGNGSLISRTVNSGATWAIVNGDPDGSDPIGGPRTPDGFFALPPEHAHAGRLLAGGGILFSDDRGATWAEANRAFPGEPGYAHVFAALPSGRVLMAGWWGVAGSDDGGASYAVSPLYQDGRYETDGLAALATPGSWQAGQPSCGLADSALCDGAVVLGTDAEAGPDVRAWRSNDGGRTWSAPVVLLQPVDGVGSSAVAGVVAVGPGSDGLGRAVAVLGRGVVYATRDGGQTWQAIGRLPIRLGGASHRARLVRMGLDGHLWVSTTLNGSADEWLYRSAEPAEAAFAVAGEGGPAEASESLGVTVRPNPVSGRVEVAVTLPAVALARIVVVDALGREVAVVLDGPAVTGRQSFSVDTSSWSAGVYVVHATSGANEASARFTVVR